MDYMESERMFFSQFVEGSFDGLPKTSQIHATCTIFILSCWVEYIAAKRRNGSWGDDPEIQVYQR